MSTPQPESRSNTPMGIRDQLIGKGAFTERIYPCALPISTIASEVENYFSKNGNGYQSGSTLSRLEAAELIEVIINCGQLDPFTVAIARLGGGFRISFIRVRGMSKIVSKGGGSVAMWVFNPFQLLTVGMQAATAGIERVFETQFWSYIEGRIAELAPPSVDGALVSSSQHSADATLVTGERGASIVGQCPACGGGNPGENRFCSNCGVTLIEPCLACKVENRVGTKFCGACGADLGRHRQVAEFRRQLTELEQRLTAVSGDEAVEVLAATNQVLKSLLILAPSETAAVQQQRSVEDRLRTHFLERVKGQREQEALAIYRELLQHVPTDPEAKAELARLEKEQAAVLTQAEKLIAVGHFRDALEVLTEGLAKFDDPKLTLLRQQTEERQRLLVALSENLIPQALQENRCVAARTYVSQLMALRKDVDGLAEARQRIQGAIKEAESCTHRGDELMRGRKPAAALAAYEQARTACADYEPAAQGVSRAAKAAATARQRQRMALTIGAVVIAISLFFFGRHLIEIHADDRAWDAASTSAEAVGTKYDEAITQYRKYLTQFPQGRHASQAKELVEVTLPQQIDDQAWEVACSGARAAGLQYDSAKLGYAKYLTQFPHGRHASNATELVTVTLPQQIDDQSWKTTVAAADGAGENYESALQQYRQYLTQFPQGRHGANAKELVDVTLPQRILVRDRERDYQTAVRDATTHIQSKDWISADHDIKRALEINSDGVENTKLQQMQKQMAADLLEQQYRDQLAKAQTYMTVGDAVEAVAFCNGALVAKPNDPTAMKLLSDATESVKRKKTYNDAMNEAQSMFGQKKYAAGLTAVDTALAAVPEDKAASLLKGQMQEAEADAHYRENMASAEQFLKRKQLDAAAFACNKALIYKPNDNAAKAMLADISKAVQGQIRSIPAVSPAGFLADLWNDNPKVMSSEFSRLYKGRVAKYVGKVASVDENTGLIVFEKDSTAYELTRTVPAREGAGSYVDKHGRAHYPPNAAQSTSYQVNVFCSVQAMVVDAQRANVKTLAKGREIMVSGRLNELLPPAVRDAGNYTLSLIDASIEATESNREIKEASSVGAPSGPVQSQTIRNNENSVMVESLCGVLQNDDPKIVEKALKSLRVMDAPGAVPKILPLLKRSNAHTVRDACRTLAVLGNKEIIPLIEPLLSDSRSDVRDDAQKAINALRDKP